MIAPLLNGDPEAITTRFPLLMLPAFAACFICARFELPGILTFVQLAALAVSGASLTNYRTERGLWMLATLYVTIYGAIFAMCVLGEYRDIVRGAAPPLSLLLDGSLSMLVIRAHIKFLWSTATFNFTLSRSHV